MKKNIKVIFGIALLMGAIISGYMKASFFVVSLIALLFTFAYIHGKWHLWREMLPQFPKLLSAFFATYTVQLIMVYLFHGIGQGIAAVLGT